MTRPAYETEADRKREEACVIRFAERTRCNVRKLSGQYSRLDWLALWPYSGKQAWIEVKCRKIRYGQYPSLILSAAKWSEGVRLAESTGALFLVLVEYMDGDYVYSFDPDHLDGGTVRLDYGGRTRATRDAGDVEPVVHISSHLFWKVP